VAFVGFSFAPINRLNIGCVYRIVERIGPNSWAAVAEHGQSLTANALVPGLGTGVIIARRTVRFSPWQWHILAVDLT